jgi:hypothetical protein
VLKLVAVSTFLLASVVAGQQDPQQDKPQVRLNYLNVCTPTPEEQAVLKGALSRISAKPGFVEDFEISRGVATVKDAGASRYVRLRREFAAQSAWLTAQYTMSTDSSSTIEILVLRLRDPKEFHEISMESRVSADAATPVSVLTADTPPARVRVERLGKGAVALARCEGADQGAYEPLFKQAADIMAAYRGALGMRTSFRSDIAWLSGRKKTVSSGKSAPSTHKQP